MTTFKETYRVMLEVWEMSNKKGVPPPGCVELYDACSHLGVERVMQAIRWSRDADDFRARIKDAL